ncbi:MAG: hypothetical protein GX113_09005 [Actinobacteria bacterium]|nr:hypothetical protein [Actinomycetota bacterium]
MAKVTAAEHTTSAVEMYLQQLADGIEILGPAETMEILNEIQAHVADVTAETGEDETIALAKFGTPRELAVRILEERGLLSGPAAIPPAPAWLRRSARGIDALIWVAGFLFFGLIPLVVVFWQSTTLAGLDPLWVVGFWLFFSGVAACSGWWSIRYRRQTERTTVGMRALGLRRVPLGEETRLVRTKDIPEQPRALRFRCLAGFSTAVAIGILGFFVFVVAVMAATAVERANRAVVNNAISNSGAAFQMVESVYAEVEAGRLTGKDPYSQSVLGPGASSAITDLVARRVAGRLAGHTAYLVPDSLNYEQWADDPVNPATHVSIPVTVNEYWQGSDRPWAGYEYVVEWVSTVTPEGYEGRWLITSVRKVDDFPDWATQ